MIVWLRPAIAKYPLIQNLSCYNSITLVWEPEKSLGDVDRPREVFVNVLGTSGVDEKLEKWRRFRFGWEPLR
jgi:hypothetical protein